MTEPHPLGEEDDATGSMIMEMVDENGSDDEELRPIIIGEQLDIEAYAALYTGRTKINRLLFIADKCGIHSTELEALKMAYDESKKGNDTQLFKEVVAKINGRLDPEYGPDDEWADDVDRQAELWEEKLKRDLDAYKKILNHIRIWKGYKDLGYFYYERGQLFEAFENYFRKRDYCSTKKHTVEMYLVLLLVSIEMGVFSRVLTYVGELEKLKGFFSPGIIDKLHCAAGLAYLKEREYKLAAVKFLATSPDTGEYYSQVISRPDIATYGGLCALASFDHAELKSKVLDNLDFQEVLNGKPNIRELIKAFYAWKYTRFYECLGTLKATLLLDFHLHDHVGDLYAQIRNKALIQCTLSSVQIDLHKLAEAFETSVNDLEEELTLLIVEDQIQGRIDSIGKMLYPTRLIQGPTFHTMLLG